MTETSPPPAADWPSLWRVMDRACRKWLGQEYLDCSSAQIQFALEQNLIEVRRQAAVAQSILDRARAAKAEEWACHAAGFTRCLYLAPPVYGPTGDIVGWEMDRVAVVHEMRCPRSS